MLYDPHFKVHIWAPAPVQCLYLLPRQGAVPFQFCYRSEDTESRRGDQWGLLPAQGLLEEMQVLQQTLLCGTCG